MTNERPTSPQADPASHEPSEARSESRAAGSGARQPDPTDHFMAILREMADLGMALTRDLMAEAQEAIAARRAARAATEAAPAPETAAVSAPDPAASPSAERPEPELTAEEIAANDPAMLAFYRLTRAVRLCMALSMKFHTDRLAREAGPAKAEPAPVRPNRPRRARQLERLVKEAIGREAPEPAEQARLERLLQERLDDDDIWRDLSRCSLGELIQRICKDLGIEADFRMWETDGWARAEIRERPPGSPYTERPDPESWEEIKKRLPKIELVIVSRAEDGTLVEEPYVPDPPSG